MPRSSNARIDHELYIYRSGRSGKEILKAVENEIIPHSATPNHPGSHQFPALTPSNDWEYWASVSPTMKRNYLVMREKDAQHRGCMARWQFWTTRRTYALYLRWYWQSLPGTAVYYFVTREDGSIESYLFPERAKLSDAQLRKIPVEKRELHLNEPKILLSPRGIRDLFYPGKDTPDDLRALLWDRLALDWGLKWQRDQHLKVVRELWNEQPA